MIYIGIDCGVNTGMALWDSNKKCFIELKTVTFWDCVNMLLEYQDRYADSMKLVIEDVEANRPVFSRDVNKFEMLKIAQNVGMNKRDCQLIKQFCEIYKIEYILSRPNKKSKTKMKAEDFERLTGWKGDSSSHSRDSAMLCWGR
jgi:hypothetical protein